MSFYYFSLFVCCALSCCRLTHFISPVFSHSRRRRISMAAIGSASDALPSLLAPHARVRLRRCTLSLSLFLSLFLSLSLSFTQLALSIFWRRCCEWNEMRCKKVCENVRESKCAGKVCTLITGSECSLLRSKEMKYTHTIFVST